MNSLTEGYLSHELLNDDEEQQLHHDLSNFVIDGCDLTDLSDTMGGLQMGKSPHIKKKHNFTNAETSDNNNNHTQSAQAQQNVVQNIDQYASSQSQTAAIIVDSHYNSVLASKYLQESQMSPNRKDQVELLQKQVNNLREELILQKEAMQSEFERQIEKARRETRDKVQRVMEKRYKKLEENQRSHSTGGISSPYQDAKIVTEPFKQSQSRTKSSLNSIRKQSKSARVQNSRNQLPQTTPSFQKNNPPQPENLSVTPAPPFNYDSLQQEYEEKLHYRLQDLGIQLQHKLRIEIEAEISAEYERRLTKQKDLIEKNLRNELMAQYEQRLQQEIQSKFDNHVQNEQDREQMREHLAEELRGAFEEAMKEYIEQENIRHQAQIDKINEEHLRNIEEHHSMVEAVRAEERAEVLNEIRNEREVQLHTRLKQQLTKKIESELHETLPKIIEERLRGQIEERLTQKLESENHKNIAQYKKRMELQVEERTNELQAKFHRDFDAAVAQKALEHASQLEKALHQKYRIHFEREKIQFQEKLLAEYKHSMNTLQKEVAAEKAEVARLKSLEQVRLKKLGEKSREIDKKLSYQQSLIEKQKFKIEQDAKEKVIREWEIMEQQLNLQKQELQKKKVLEDDLGCEQLSRSYHIAVQNKSSLSPPKQAIIQNQISSFGQIPPAFKQTEPQFEEQSPEEQVIFSGDENTSHFNYAHGQGEEDRPLSSVPRQINYPSSLTGIGSIASGSTPPSQIQIKPTDSKELVQRLLKQSIEKFQLQAKLNPQQFGQTPSKENQSENKSNSFRSNYQEVLQRQSSQKMLNNHQSPAPNFNLQTHSPSSFKQEAFQVLQVDQQAEQEFNETVTIIEQSLESLFASMGTSDHGLFAYLTHTLWPNLFISFSSRLKFFAIIDKLIISRDIKSLYRVLEQETSRLSELQRDAADIYSLMSQKEDRFGNLITQKYHQVEHSSQLFSLRADLIRKIDEYQRRNSKQAGKKCVVTWRGVPYMDLCKLEKIEADNRIKDDIREEIEAKRRRGTVQSTYNRLMN